MSVLGLIIVAGVLTWMEFGSIIQGALSAEKLDDGMYYMEYKGDESITTFSTDFYGFGEDYKPEGFKNQYMALAGLFLALDGINEKGFAIAVLDAGDKVVTHQNTSKPDLAPPLRLRNTC